MRHVVDSAGGQDLQMEAERYIARNMLRSFARVVEVSQRGEQGILLERNLRPQAQYLFEFMELLVKPMVNTYVADPRLSVTEEAIQFVKESGLPKLSLLVLSCEDNGLMTRLFALKFYKSLFTLLDKDNDLLECMVAEDPIKACSSILRQLKARIRNPNMLQSACLELINAFGEAAYKYFGPELHQQIT